MVKDPWDVKQDKCPAPQIVGWWANFFSSIWAFQLSFRLALINSSQVGLPDSFALETGFEEIRARAAIGKSTFPPSGLLARNNFRFTRQALATNMA
jgi:hypothetical protein